MADELNEFTAMVARAKNGDAGALASLVQQYESEIRRAAHVALGPALRPFLDSMDLVQSVHRSLLSGLANDRLDFSCPEQLVRLAVLMVERKAAWHWRRPKASRPAHTADINLEETIVGLNRPSDDPAHEAETQDLVKYVLKQLNDTERRLLELRLQNYSTTEAAEAMGVDPNYVRVMLYRIRQRFSELDIPPECY